MVTGSKEDRITRRGESYTESRVPGFPGDRGVEMSGILPLTPLFPHEREVPVKDCRRA